MKYHTNPVMRTKIVTEATRLFYDLGYKETTIAMIAQACETSKGLVSYHFKNKLDLAQEIFELSRFSARQLINEKIFYRFRTTDMEESPAVQDRINLRQLKEDPKVFDFFQNISPELLKQQAVNDHGLTFYREYDELFGIRSKRHAVNLEMLSTASKGAATSLILSYFGGNLKEYVDYCEFEDYRVALMYKLMNYNDDEIQHIVRNSRDIADKLDIVFLPYFKLK